MCCQAIFDIMFCLAWSTIVAGLLKLPLLNLEMVLLHGMWIVLELEGTDRGQ